MISLDIESLSAEGKRLHAALVDKGIFKRAGDYAARPEDGAVTYAEANPITAVEKFLGYYDDKKNIAFAPSISFNTDLSIAQAYCRYSKEENADSIMLDGAIEERYTRRAAKALDNFRRLFRIGGSFKFYIKRVKRYGLGKGLGESAAVAAASAKALAANVFGERAAADDFFVSLLARYASGSGTRSATGGFSVWVSYPGMDELECHGARLPVDLGGFSFIAYPNPSEIKTMDVHKVVSGSPFYETWVRDKYRKIGEIIDSDFDLGVMMKHAQEDTFLLNSMVTSRGIFLQTRESMKIIEAIMSFREEVSDDVYMTADTGPSIVVMAKSRKLLDKFSETIGITGILGTVAGSPRVKINGLGESDLRKFIGS